MCYFNSLIITEKKFIELQKIEKQIDEAFFPVVNGFEFGNFPIIKPEIRENKFVDWNVATAEWGLIPYYVSNREQLNTERIKLSTLNARNDNLLNSNIWKNAAHTGRCLILSSGFFEYRHVPKIGKSGSVLKTVDKYPYFITVNTEDPFFFMAGIYSTWVDKNTGETVDTFAIVTTDANGLMERIHNTKKRMPTILTKSLAEAWLNPNLSDNEIREIADYQFNENEMIAWTVAKDFKTSEIPNSRYEYALSE
jgi:putative SOS response-associated peptidase YedK